jgi:elongation factor P--(R)-beta-lysine ligase
MSLVSDQSPQLQHIARLKDRAQMLAKVRHFFDTRGFFEVDCPALSPYSPLDLHIDVMTVLLKDGKRGYLHTSPEYGMKRLLSQGSGDIYQLSHVFRDGDEGRLHNPEFTMVEWYRENFSFEAFLKESVDFLYLFLGPLPIQLFTYREALRTFAQIDYVSASLPLLLETLHHNEISLSEETEWDRDSLLNLFMNFCVEPHLGDNQLTIITDFPASQAALSKTYWKEEEEVAERFEIYYQGIELANGYHELTDPQEQRKRFLKTNQQRQERGKSPLPIDELFLQALEKGLPDCYGIAVGFDRLMMLRHQVDTLTAILP